VRTGLQPTKETGSELYAIEAALARSKADRICTTEEMSEGRVQREGFVPSPGSREEDCRCELQTGDCVAI
jgi:hypothetical protein